MPDRSAFRPEHCRAAPAGRKPEEDAMQFQRLSAAAAAFGMMSVLAACGATTQRTTNVESGGEVATSTTVVTPANNRTIPSGAILTTSLDQSLGTKMNKAGDTFTAT